MTWPMLNSKDDTYLDIGASATISTSNLTAEYKRTTAFWKDVLRPELPQRNTKTGVVSGSFLTTVRGSCIAAFHMLCLQLDLFASWTRNQLAPGREFSKLTSQGLYVPKMGYHRGKRARIVSSSMCTHHVNRQRSPCQ